MKVYVLEACVRHIWFDWNNKLIELDVRYPIPVKNMVKYMSLAEASQYHEYCKGRKLDHEEHRIAARNEIMTQYETLTGLPWDSSARISGRAKRGSTTARTEAAEARNATGGRKPK